MNLKKNPHFLLFSLEFLHFLIFQTQYTQQHPTPNTQQHHNMKSNPNTEYLAKKIPIPSRAGRDDLNPLLLSDTRHAP